MQWAISPAPAGPSIILVHWDNIYTKALSFQALTIGLTAKIFCKRCQRKQNMSSNWVTQCISEIIRVSIYLRVMPRQSQRHRFQQPPRLLCEPSSSPLGKNRTWTKCKNATLRVLCLVSIPLFEQANGHQAPPEMSSMWAMQWQRSFRPTECAWPRTRACSRGRCKGQGDTHLLSSVGSPGRNTMNTYMREVLGKPKAHLHRVARVAGHLLHFCTRDCDRGSHRRFFHRHVNCSPAPSPCGVELPIPKMIHQLEYWNQPFQCRIKNSEMMRNVVFFWRKITVDGFGVCENSSLPRCSGKSWLRACCQEGTAWYKLRLGGEISQHGN